MTCNDVCVSMDWDYGGNDFYHEAMRRARKPYKCIECGDAIAVGDLYEHATGKYEGDIYTNRTCAPCAEIRKTFFCEGWIFGEVWEAIREQLFPRWNDVVAIDCLAKLTTHAAIAKMRAEYAEYAEDQAA